MKNGLAIAGFVVSLCAAGLFAAALLCLMGVMLYPCIGLLFGGMAFSTAITGVALSGVGDHRSRRPEARGAGFAVLDLGRDGSAARFVDAALELNADIIAISTLMTTTMDNMKSVIDLLDERGLRERFRVIIGGKPCSAGFARRIGASGYSSNAAGAVRLCRRLLEGADNGA